MRAAGLAEKERAGDLWDSPLLFSYQQIILADIAGAGGGIVVPPSLGIRDSAVGRRKGIGPAVKTCWPSDSSRSTGPIPRAV